MTADLTAKTCQWVGQAEALLAFADFVGKTESASHIKPLHWYVACRLVVEGGFDPDDITPRPPFTVRRRSGKKPPILIFDPTVARGGEQTIYGGLKTKKVDVVVTKAGIGPVLAVSCKGVTGAFRNLTNRMEETIGECTNLHITYPALVIGYLVLLRANRHIEAVLCEISDDDDTDQHDRADHEPEADEEELDTSKPLTANDIAMDDNGGPVASIVRFHNALKELAGRRGIREDVSRYESIGFALVEMHGADKGALFQPFPTEDSLLLLSRYFDTLYARYDERFVVSAPDLKKITRRLEWDATSPGLQLVGLDYSARVIVQ